MKKIGYIFISLTAVLLLGCIEDPKIDDNVINGGMPVFNNSSSEMLNHTASSVEVKAELSRENGSHVTEYGFCYGSSPSPTINDTKVAVGSGIGAYSTKIENLESNKTYYIRPYATNASGTQYGSSDIVVVTNSGLGAVVTTSPTDIHAKTAVVGGKITDAGEGEIKSRGVYYSTTMDFASSLKAESTETTDSFTCVIPSLTPDTKYYVRAFVENTFGQFYGNIDSLTTINGMPDIGILTSTRGFSDIKVASTVMSVGDVEESACERGFIWSTDSIISYDKGTKVQCGTGSGSFSTTINGLVADQQYYVCAYVHNEYGTVYGEKLPFYVKQNIPTVKTEESNTASIQYGAIALKGIIMDEGVSRIDSAGICWSHTNSTPTLADNVLNMSIGIDNSFTGQLLSLTGSSKYYYRAYAVNSGGVAYGDVKSFVVPPLFNTNLQHFAGEKPLENSCASFIVGDVIYILGGDNGPSFSKKLWSYNITENSWRERLPMETEAKWQSAVSYSRGAFVYGGLGNDRVATNALIYYGEENAWDTLYAPCPDSAYMSVGCALGNGLFFVGGKIDTVKKSVWSYQISLGWVRMPDFPVVQYGGVMVGIDGTMYAGLGKDASGVCNGKFWKTSDGCQTWTELSPCTINTGSILVGETCRGRIYVIDESYYIIEYNPETDTWTKKSQLPAGYREIQCMCRYGDKLYIGLGSANALVCYDPYLDN